MKFKHWLSGGELSVYSKRSGKEEVIGSAVLGFYENGNIGFKVANNAEVPLKEIEDISVLQIGLSSMLIVECKNKDIIYKVELEKEFELKAFRDEFLPYIGTNEAS